MYQDSDFPPDASESEPPIPSPVSTLTNIYPETPTFLPPQDDLEMPTLVLELDKTLISSTEGQDHANPPARYDFIIRYEFDGHSTVRYVTKRPWLDEFLEKMSSKYELVIFTESIKEYASLVIDQIDPRGLISYRLYRDSCRETSEGKYVKELNKIGRDIMQLIVIDSGEEMFYLFSQNVIWVREFIDDFEDDVLVMLGEFLEDCSEYEDLRAAVSEYA